MSVLIRPATRDDAEPMSALINPIIAEGATTAHRRPFDAARMRAHYIAPPRLIACVTAWDGEALLGFQSTEFADPDWEGPHMVPEDWGCIGSFVNPDAQGRGVGRALFAATLKAAQVAGAVAIDATIRADNVPGLAYYSRIGFVDYAITRDVPLSDGTRVDRISKRYDIG